MLLTVLANGLFLAVIPGERSEVGCGREAMPLRPRTDSSAFGRLRPWNDHEAADIQAIVSKAGSQDEMVLT